MTKRAKDGTAAQDLVLDGAAPLALSLGKHTTDQMVSFCMKTPSMCEIEYGWNGLKIDHATWTSVVHDWARVGGHRPAEAASRVAG